MCGIAGIVGPRAHEHVRVVERMNAAMKHRGPDGSGVYVAPSGSCVLGHRRLAVLDPSAAAGQPFELDRGELALSYNGECYNFPALRAEILAEGQVVDSSGDTEVLARMLRSRGAGVLPRINGMFALAYWDDPRQTLLLARDRFGQKPLYYTEVDGLLVFASEVRALLASGLVSRLVDRAALVGFLSHGSVPEPWTIVAGVKSLCAATLLTRQARGEARSKVYWRAPMDKQERGPKELRAEFAAAVERHLVSDAPVGVFLSGGIDSSAITMAAAKVAQKRLTSVCVVCPDQPHLSEHLHARRIAERAGTDHHEIPFTEREQIQQISAALEAMDQPSVDGINTFIAAAAAREAGLTVALSGLGGDELFGGYRQSFATTLQLLSWSRRLGPMRGFAAGLLARTGSFRPQASKMADLLGSPGDLLSSYLVRRKLYTSQQLQEMFPGITGLGWTDGLPPGSHAALQELVADREPTDAIGLLEMQRYMGQQLLRDSDAMGMAQSLEIRMPFLDAGFAEMALKLDASARRPGACPKARLVECLGDWLPRSNVTRPKQGFLLPIENAMRGAMRGRVEAGIEGLGKLGWAADLTVIRRQWRRFCDRRPGLGWTRPWGLFVLSEFMRRHSMELEPELEILADLRVST